jgi:predicted DNA-binding ribbon-helix-helix protein
MIFGNEGDAGYSSIPLVQGKRRQRATKSQVVKRSINFTGRRTSITLEDAFWNGVKEIAASRAVTVPNLVNSINCERQHANLSSAVRLFVLRYYRDQLFGSRTARSNDQTRASLNGNSQGC